MHGSSSAPPSAPQDLSGRENGMGPQGASEASRRSTSLENLMRKTVLSRWPSPCDTWCAVTTAGCHTRDTPESFQRMMTWPGA